jgi:hypothetical protein
VTVTTGPCKSFEVPLHVRQELGRECHRSDTGIRLLSLVEESSRVHFRLRALNHENGVLVVDVPPTERGTPAPGSSPWQSQPSPSVFGPMRAAPARRSTLYALMTGLAALLVDIYLY